MTSAEGTPDWDAVRHLLERPHYPRSAGYDPAWVIENMMGPHPLWLVEALTQVMPLRSGERVLDLGCGTALTSVFLAREFGVQVWAADHWIPPTPNLERVRAAGLDGAVFPIAVEAHALPFADEFFDAIISIDAYHYFGTDDLYLGYCTRFLKPSGHIGIVVPGFLEEPPVVPPPSLASLWDPGLASFHSSGWWRRHWERSQQVVVEHAEVLPHGWEDWLLWTRACVQAGWRAPTEALQRAAELERELLERDGGRLLGFARTVARRRRRPAGIRIRMRFPSARGVS